MKREHGTASGDENSWPAADIVSNPSAADRRKRSRLPNAATSVTSGVSSGRCQLKPAEAVTQAGTKRQQELTAGTFIHALGCEHVQLALARFQQMGSKPCDIETVIASIYAVLQRANMSVHEVGTVQVLACLWLLDAYDCQYHHRLSDFCWRFLKRLQSPICAGSTSALGTVTRTPPFAPATPAAGVPKPGPEQAAALEHQPPQTPPVPSCRCREAAHKCPQLRATLLAAQLDILHRCGWALHLNATTVLSQAAAALRTTDRPPPRQTTLLSRLASRFVSSRNGGRTCDDMPDRSKQPQHHTFSGMCDSIRRRAAQLTQLDSAAAASPSLAAATPQQRPPPRRHRLVREAARLAASSLDGPHWAWIH